MIGRITMQFNSSDKVVTCHKNDHMIDCTGCEECTDTCFIKISSTDQDVWSLYYRVKSVKFPGWLDSSQLCDSVRYYTVMKYSTRSKIILLADNWITFSNKDNLYETIQRIRLHVILIRICYCTWHNDDELHVYRSIYLCYWFYVIKKRRTVPGRDMKSV